MREARNVLETALVRFVTRLNLKHGFGWVIWQVKVREDMAIADELQARTGGQCELCGVAGAAEVFAVPHSELEGSSLNAGAGGHVLLCATCRGQVEPDAADAQPTRDV